MNAITVTLIGTKSHDISDELISLRVENEVNQIPTARIQLATGNFVDREFPLFKEADFQIGQSIDIKIRYETSGQPDVSIFQGVITSSSFGVSEGQPIMNLELKDPCFRLRESVNTQLFTKKNDKQMITSVCNKLGLSVKKASASLSSFIFDQYVKKQSSDWSFISERLAAHGLLGVWNNGALSALAFGETSGSVNLDLGIDDILDINLEEDASQLNQEVELHYWNLKANKLETVRRKTTISAAKDAKVASSVYTFLDITDKKEAEAMLNHFTCVQELSSKRGTIDIPGNSSIQLMQKLTLKSLPAAFNGSFPITKVVHAVRSGAWITTIGIGSNKIQEQSAEMIARSISAELTSIQSATALKWEKDPEGLGRIPVQILGFSKDKYWVFPAQVSAGTKQSSFLLPEEGEQLMIGFMHGSYNQGVVLTSIYSGNRKPPSPFKLDAITPFGFVSKSGLKHLFDDDKKTIETSSSSRNKVLIDDKSGIELDSGKNIKSTSRSKTEIKASSTMNLTATIINLKDSSGNFGQ